MGRPKREGAGIPEWMVTFGDMMSLLLCFFIMLFSMSIIAEVKWEALIETQRKRLGYAGRSPRESTGRLPSTAISTTSELDRRTAALTGSQPMTGRGEFGAVQSPNVDGDPVKGGLIRFRLGSDVLTEQAKRDLGAIFPILRNSPNKIMVKGHSAPGEEGEGMFNRDVDLAFSRAINTMNHLVELGLREEFFIISAADATGMPNRAILPQGTNPRLAGASAAVYLLSEMPRAATQEE